MFDDFDPKRCHKCQKHVKKRHRKNTKLRKFSNDGQIENILELHEYYCRKCRRELISYWNLYVKKIYAEHYISRISDDTCYVETTKQFRYSDLKKRNSEAEIPGWLKEVKSSNEVRESDNLKQVSATCISDPFTGRLRK
jgi:hypothetical protein